MSIHMPVCSHAARPPFRFTISNAAGCLQVVKCHSESVPVVIRSLEARLLELRRLVRIDGVAYNRPVLRYWDSGARIGILGSIGMAGGYARRHASRPAKDLERGWAVCGDDVKDDLRRVRQKQERVGQHVSSQ